MVRYSPPLRDFQFLLSDVFGLDEIVSFPGGADLNEETAMAIAETFGAFAANSLAPLNAAADRGCLLDEGNVTTPVGHLAAWQAFCNDGWNGLAASQEWGGQGLPHFVHHMMREMMASGCLAFSLFHENNFGVIKAVSKHGTDALKKLALAQLVSGVCSP